MHTRDQSDIDCAPSGGLSALPQGHGSQPRGSAGGGAGGPECGHLAGRSTKMRDKIVRPNGKIPIHSIEFEEFRLASGNSLLLGPLLI